mmetsp:Transcript_10233/g.46305  ORF Transcript_10233/g.46305 Transcript_10233/m.46305 type:complete len:174 (-) Transcript_10233:857-1378(-)
MSRLIPTPNFRSSFRGSARALRHESNQLATRPSAAELHTRARCWQEKSSLPISVSRHQLIAQQGKGPNPVVMERFQGVASQLMNQRIIRLGGAVDDDSCNLIVAQLLWLDATDPKKDITIYVNSPGGSVTAGMAVFDTMRHVRPDVSTVCVGLAASMGVCSVCILPLTSFIIV